LLWLLSSELGLWYLTASVLSYLLSMTYNFLLQRNWTFGGRGGVVLHQAILFVVVNLLGLVLNTAIVYLLVEMLDVWYLAAQAAASVAVAVQSFFAYRWIFARHENARACSGRTAETPPINLGN